MLPNRRCAFHQGRRLVALWPLSAGGEVRRILAGRRCQWQRKQQGGLEQGSTGCRAEGAAPPHFSSSGLPSSPTREPGALELKLPPLFQFALLAGASPLLSLVTLSIPFPKAPSPSSPPQLHSGMCPEGKLSLLLGNKGPTGKAGWSSTLKIICK